MLLHTDTPRRFRLFDHCERVPTSGERIWGRIRRLITGYPQAPQKTMAQLIVLQCVRDNAAALHICTAPGDDTARLEYLCLSTAQPKHDTIQHDWDELDRAAAKPAEPRDYFRPTRNARNWPYLQVVSDFARRPEIDADWKWYEMIPPPQWATESLMQLLSAAAGLRPDLPSSHIQFTALDRPMIAEIRRLSPEDLRVNFRDAT